MTGMRELIEEITRFWHLTAIEEELQRRDLAGSSAETTALLHRIWDAQESVPEQVHRHLVGTLTVPHVVRRLWMAAADTDLIQAWIAYTTGKDN